MAPVPLLALSAAWQIAARSPRGPVVAGPAEHVVLALPAPRGRALRRKVPGGPASHPGVSVVTGVRWVQGTLAISGNGPMAARVMTLHAPERVVVDLLDAELADPTLSGPLAVGGHPVRQVRIRVHPESGSVRFVLDCDSPAAFAVARPPGGHQLVVQRADLAPDPDQQVLALGGDPAPGGPSEVPTYGPPLPATVAAATVAAVGPLAGPPLPAAETYGPFLPASPASPPARSTGVVGEADERAPVPVVDEPLRPAPVEGADRPVAAAGGQEPQASETAAIVPPAQVSARWLWTADGGTLVVEGDRAIAPEVHEDLAPTRLLVRVPDARLAGVLPPAGGPATALSAHAEGRDLVLELDLAGTGRGSLYELATTRRDGGRRVEVTARPQAIPAGAPLVVIDPGHGGHDPGAIGPGGDHEADQTLALAHRLADALWRRHGIASVLTRTADVELDLAPRVAVADLTGAGLLVSLHCNAFTATDSVGVETYYRNPGSAAFARVVHGTLVHDLGRVDRGVKQGRLFVLRGVVPSILVESGFITNRDEERWLEDADAQGRVADAIADGVHTYVRGTRLGFRP